MRLAFLALPAALALTACATPREACIGSVQRELRTIDRLIASTQANLARGYGLEERQEVRTVRGVCEGTNDDGTTFTFACPQTQTRTTQVPVAIDLNAERRTLASLQERRAQQQAATDAAIQQCIARNPE